MARERDGAVAEAQRVAAGADAARTEAATAREARASAVVPCPLCALNVCAFVSRAVLHLCAGTTHKQPPVTRGPCTHCLLLSGGSPGRACERARGPRARPGGRGVRRPPAAPAGAARAGAAGGAGGSAGQRAREHGPAGARPVHLKTEDTPALALHTRVHAAPACCRVCAAWVPERVNRSKKGAHTLTSDYSVPRCASFSSAYRRRRRPGQRRRRSRPRAQRRARRRRRRPRAGRRASSRGSCKPTRSC